MKAGEETAEAKPVEQPGRFRIYLADTSDTLRAVEVRVLNELRKSPEIEVLSKAPPPFPADAHDQAVRAALETTDLSVHLLDAFPGREVEGREGSFYPQRQAEIAIAHGKPQLIWVPQNLTRESIEDENYADFLERLEKGPRERARYDFQREMPSSIVREIQDKFEIWKSQPPSATPPFNSNRSHARPRGSPGASRGGRRLGNGDFSH